MDIRMGLLELQSHPGRVLVRGGEVAIVISRRQGIRRITRDGGQSQWKPLLSDLLAADWELYTPAPTADAAPNGSAQQPRGAGR